MRWMIQKADVKTEINICWFCKPTVPWKVRDFVSLLAPNAVRKYGKERGFLHFFFAFRFFFLQFLADEKLVGTKAGKEKCSREIYCSQFYCSAACNALPQLAILTALWFICGIIAGGLRNQYMSHFLGQK